MKKISGYFFSLILLFLWSTVCFSQAEKTVGLRLGFDVSRLSLYYFEPERKNFEVSSDMELIKRVYPTIELGWNNVKLKNDTLFNYYSNGYYVRLGVDRNFIKPENKNDKEMFFGGIRYGYAFFNDYADNIIIKDNYWGNFTGDLYKKSLHASWVEFVAGFKVELFTNFFLGWSLRGRVLISKTKSERPDPYWIPGFGKGNAKTSVGFNYSIFYNIPLYKTKHQ